MDVSKADFRAFTLSGLGISLTETLRVDPRLQLARQLQSTEVLSQPMMIQMEMSALGSSERDYFERVTNGHQRLYSDRGAFPGRSRELSART